MPPLRWIAVLAVASTMLAASPATGDPPPVNGEILYVDQSSVLAITVSGETHFRDEGRLVIDRAASPAIDNSRDPAWSPSATRVAFSANRNLWTAGADGTDARQLSSAPAANDLAPDWSPDGGLIAFTRLAASSDVWVMGADDGANPRPLASGPAIERQPAWSPDGRTIAFTSDRGGSFAIWTMDADGSNARPLAAARAYNSDPTWSPDGTRIAFAAGDAPNRTDIVTVDATGGDLRPVTAGAAGDRRPAWSPDGRQIVFARGTALLVADLPAGSPATLIAGLASRPQNPDWGPLPPPVEQPQALETANVDPNGPVAVKVPGAVAPAPLTRAAELPVGTVVDTTAPGTSLDITAAAAGGGTTTAEASLGAFTYLQTGDRKDPTNELLLRPARNCGSRRTAASYPLHEPVRVRVKRPGHWWVRGPHSINGASRTSWVTTVQCTRTITEVRTGVVTVRDFKTGNRVRVPAGRCYVAPSREPRSRKRCQ